MTQQSGLLDSVNTIVSFIASGFALVILLIVGTLFGAWLFVAWHITTFCNWIIDLHLFDFLKDAQYIDVDFPAIVVLSIVLVIAFIIDIVILIEYCKPLPPLGEPGWDY